MQKKIATISMELRAHAPFTLFGAFTGILCMLLFKNIEHETGRRVFYVFHPLHVVLSAIVTASMFKLHTKEHKFVAVLLIGLVGSLGIATLSDSLIPYIGELLLGMHIHLHAHEHASFAEQAHIGFIEEWQIVVPAAVAGVLIAYFRPKTKFPHAGHVLLSTWASSFHIIMAMGGQLSLAKAVGSFGFLFLAVWLPCCISDIVFPLLFVKPTIEQLEAQT
jgi:TctA family transporter